MVVISVEKKRTVQNNSITPIWKLTQLELCADRIPSAPQELLDQTSANLMERAYLDIKKRIQTCDYMPGTELNEKKIFEDFPYGRTPTREAILYLKRDGLIEVYPRKGMRIAPITSKNLSDVFVLRRILERSVFVESRTLTSKDILIAHGRKLDANRDADFAIFEIDRQLHFDLLHELRNEQLNEVYAALLDKCYRAYTYLLHCNIFLGRLVYEKDKKLIRAILAEETGSIQEAIDDYGKTISIRLLESLPNVAEQGSSK